MKRERQKLFQVPLELPWLNRCQLPSISLLRSGSKQLRCSQG
jgi:hypothetical protein